jgi:hypothetical protein
VKWNTSSLDISFKSGIFAAGMYYYIRLFSIWHNHVHGDFKNMEKSTKVEEKSSKTYYFHFSLISFKILQLFQVVIVNIVIFCIRIKSLQFIYFSMLYRKQNY